MPTFTISCPHCGQHIEVDESASGQSAECPTCQGAIILPDAPKATPKPLLAGIIDDPLPQREAEHGGEQEERILFTKAPAARAYVGRMVAAAVWSIVGIIILLLVDFGAFSAVVLPPLLVCGATALSIWIETHSTEYKLTTERFFLRRGLIAKHLEEVELFRVKDVTVKQGIIQRLMGFGSISILSTDDSAPHLTMRGVAGPIEVKELFRKTYRAARKREGVRSAEFIPS